MTTNMTWGFMGGSVEFCPAGEIDIDDEQTGQKKHLTWRNHMKISVGRRTTKLYKNECIAIFELMKNEKEFRNSVNECP
jgi:hypothetical protein